MTHVSMLNYQFFVRFSTVFINIPLVTLSLSSIPFRMASSSIRSLGCLLAFSASERVGKDVDFALVVQHFESFEGAVECAFVAIEVRRFRQTHELVNHVVVLNQVHQQAHLWVQVGGEGDGVVAIYGDVLAVDDP
jgi:hypothetical protein